MKASNGWYSVHDTEHRPVSGEEVLALALIDDSKTEEDPFADPANCIYYVATWYNAGDIFYNESTQEEEAKCASAGELLRSRLFGIPSAAPADGFYTQEPFLMQRKDTDGGRLAPYAIAFRWERLAYDTEGTDGLICWKPLDYPTED